MWSQLAQDSVQPYVHDDGASGFCYQAWLVFTSCILTFQK